MVIKIDKYSSTKPSLRTVKRVCGPTCALLEPFPIGFTFNRRSAKKIDGLSRYNSRIKGIVIDTID